MGASGKIDAMVVCSAASFACAIGLDPSRPNANSSLLTLPHIDEKIYTACGAKSFQFKWQLAQPLQPYMVRVSREFALSVAALSAIAAQPPNESSRRRFRTVSAPQIRDSRQRHSANTGLQRHYHGKVLLIQQSVVCIAATRVYYIS